MLGTGASRFATACWLRTTALRGARLGDALGAQVVGGALGHHGDLPADPREHGLEDLGLVAGALLALGTTTRGRRPRPRRRWRRGGRP